MDINNNKFEMAVLCVCVCVCVPVEILSINRWLADFQSLNLIEMNAAYELRDRGHRLIF